MKHKNTITIGNALVILMLVSIIFVSHWQMTQLAIYDKKENFTFNVIQHLDHLLKILRDVRKDQRSFTSSREDVHLASYYKSLREIEIELVTLNGLADESPWFQKQLAAIQLQVKEKLTYFDELIRLRKQVDIQDAINGNISRVKMAEIHTNVAAAKEEAIRQMRLLKAKQKTDFNQMEYLLIINSGIISILLITVYVILRREITSRIKNNEHGAILQEQERLALSREVHDDIGQSLTILKLDLSLIEKSLPPCNEEIAGHLKVMRDNLDLLLTKTHDITAKLRPPLLDNLGLIEAIEWQVSEFKRRSNIEFHLMLNEEIHAHDEHVALAIIRILQEALTNVILHARATEVSISMCEREDGFILEIADNGCGITTKEVGSTNSYGIMGMQERASYFNGKIIITKNFGNGTIVSLTIPRDALKEKN